MSDPTPTGEKPTLTERDLSYHVAVAGAEAKDAAMQSGGDTVQLRALVEAARLDPPSNTVNHGQPRQLKGFTLRSDDLLVTLCFNLHSLAFGVDPRQQLGRLASDDSVTPDRQAADRMQALAVLGFIFTQAEDAWELLDLATDSTSTEDQRRYAKRDFLRAALEFGGTFEEQEIGLLLLHLTRLARQVPTEDMPGKREAPAP